MKLRGLKYDFTCWNKCQVYTFKSWDILYSGICEETWDR